MWSIILLQKYNCFALFNNIAKLLVRSAKLFVFHNLSMRFCGENFRNDLNRNSTATKKGCDKNAATLNVTISCLPFAIPAQNPQSAPSNAPDGKAVPKRP